MHKILYLKTLKWQHRKYLFLSLSFLKPQSSMELMGICYQVACSLSGYTIKHIRYLCTLQMYLTLNNGVIHHLECQGHLFMPYIIFEIVSFKLPWDILASIIKHEELQFLFSLPLKHGMKLEKILKRLDPLIWTNKLNLYLPNNIINECDKTFVSFKSLHIYRAANIIVYQTLIMIKTLLFST